MQKYVHGSHVCQHWVALKTGDRSLVMYFDTNYQWKIAYIAIRGQSLQTFLKAKKVPPLKSGGLKVRLRRYFAVAGPDDAADRAWEELCANMSLQYTFMETVFEVEFGRSCDILKK